MVQKRVRSIFLAVLFIGGLLPSVQFSVPGNQASLSSGPQRTDPAREFLTFHAPSPTFPPTIPSTATALQPLPPTPSRTPIRKPTSTVTFTVTAVPPTPLPRSAGIEGIYGYGQLFPLSCEARSAADWARHFDIEIHELDFLKRLPRSDNPDKGFVGSLNGGWGLTPPGSYGVHAGPIAIVLRQYGARAVNLRNMSFEALKRELADGKPVIVWVTGHVAPGKGIPYEIDGQTVTVAPYEHTVIAIGYDEDKDRVTFLDGKQVYWRSYETFFQSWGALENMAVVWDD